MLMTQMLRGMRRSMLSDDENEGGLGRETMTDTMDIELGRALASVGGFGLSSTLLKAIEKSVGVDDAEKSGQTVGAGGPGGSSGSDRVPSTAVPSVLAPDLKVPAGRISSGYGWRRDPFSGAPQFHKGIDVARRYGADVQAAAGGRVVFAGDQGTYGTTVVVDHGTGQKTRYAHLSATDVKAGDQVGAGQVIGRVGASGRATGAHLHFEVMNDGQATDPTDHH
jgi:murein DD-endopeptidase MepM/ murein hydrolase activator NlpD